jgi:hypothetical protein
MQPSDASAHFPSLSQAREDLAMAESLVDDPAARVRHALSAKESAVRVALATTTTSREERAAARDLVVEAMGLSGELAEIAAYMAGRSHTGPADGLEID